MTDTSASDTAQATAESLDIVRRIQSGETASISVAQITDIHVDLEKARHSLTPKQFESFYALHSKLKTETVPVAMYESSYTVLTHRIIVAFDNIAPFEKYGKISESNSREILPKIRAYGYTAYVPKELPPAQVKQVFPVPPVTPANPKKESKGVGRIVLGYILGLTTYAAGLFFGDVPTDIIETIARWETTVYSSFLLDSISAAVVANVGAILVFRWVARASRQDNIKFDAVLISISLLFALAAVYVEVWPLLLYTAVSIAVCVYWIWSEAKKLKDEGNS